MLPFIRLSSINPSGMIHSFGSALHVYNRDGTIGKPIASMLVVVSLFMLMRPLQRSIAERSSGRNTLSRIAANPRTEGEGRDSACWEDENDGRSRHCWRGILVSSRRPSRVPLSPPLVGRTDCRSQICINRLVICDVKASEVKLKLIRMKKVHL